jgi:NADH:ubiquinone oxidoreductase subunit K
MKLIIFSFSVLLLHKERNFMDQIQFLAVSLILFLLGMWGIFLNRKNILIMLMSIELMLLAVNLNFLVFSVYLDDLIGQIFALLILTVAAAESAIGLALLVVYYRVRGSISVEFINLMKG